MITRWVSARPTSIERATGLFPSQGQRRRQSQSPNLLRKVSANDDTEVGKVIANLDAELVKEWATTGGIEQNLKSAQATIDAIIEHKHGTGLEAYFEQLPDHIQNQAFRHFALSPPRGPHGAQKLVAQFENSLTDEQFEQWEAWVNRLSPEERQAILDGINRKR